MLEEAMIDDALIGTWLLRSHRVEDSATGEWTEPFGPTPAGVLIVLADGRMSALIVGAAAGDTPAPLIAYSGQYRIPSPGSFVTRVDVASIAPWVGTEQARSYTIADDRLELSTAPAKMPDADGKAETRIGTMVWVREPTVASHGTSG